MSPIGDSLDPKDDIQTRLSRPPAASEMPAALLCPSGHRAHRIVVKMTDVLASTTADPQDDNAVAVNLIEFVEVPIWICPKCVVSYRYQECTLPPGEEGHP